MKLTKGTKPVKRTLTNKKKIKKHTIIYLPSYEEIETDDSITINELKLQGYKLETK